MKQYAHTYVLDLIAADELDKACTLLQNPKIQPEREERQDALQLSGRLARLVRQINRGTISSGDANVEHNQIRNALLVLADTVPQDNLIDTEELDLPNIQSQKWKRLLPALMYLLLASGLAGYLLQPKSTVRIEADLEVDRFQFRYHQGPNNFMQGAAQSYVWQDYQEVTVEGKQLRYDDSQDGMWDGTYSLRNDLVISPYPGVSGVSIEIYGAEMGSASIEPNAFITFERPAEDLELFRVIVEQENPLRVKWIYADSADVVAEMANLVGLAGIDEIPFLSQLRLYPPEGSAREIRGVGVSGTVALEMSLTPDNLLEGYDLDITEPQFIRSEEQQLVSTITAGEIRVKEVNKAGFDPILLEEKEKLSLTTVGKLSLERFSISQSGISLTLSGTVDEIEMGVENSSVKPSRLEWLWMNKRLPLLAVGILLIGLLFFLPGPLRERIMSVLKLIPGVG